ncbi:MAG: cytochrome bc complex cytochrome b subunit [Bacteroidetes bacterium]|nr:cytochrome bc complex cytochrome b subunit [Bacteroidota bacterium]
MKKTIRKIDKWLDERYNLAPLKEFIDHKKVPQHRTSIWYYMGGAALFLFMIQVITGILLLLYYKPGESTSYESVRFIMTQVKFGWLVRSIHSWAANLMVFFVFVHMFSVFFSKAYKKPRELTWVTGFITLLLTFGFGFSGYLLPWDELSFFATKIGTDIIGVLPIIGEPLKTILRGSPDVTGATLTRFYGIHVAVLPMLFTFFLVLHLLFVQKLGMHEPESFQKLPEKEKKYMPFFPNFFVKDALFWLIIFNVLLFLSVYIPWGLGLKADAFVPAPAGIRPEWYFMFMFQSLKMLPAHILFLEGELVGVLFFGAAFLFWMLFPFLGIKDENFKKFKPVFWIGITVVTFIITLTIIGYLD